MKLKHILLTLSLGLIFILTMGGCSKTEHDLFCSIHGIVSDASNGNPVANATITLSPGGRATVSGSDGQFEFIDLDPGQYTITVQCTGFNANRKTVNAISSEAVRADIPLTPSE